MDLDIARTPNTRCPFHCITLPPAASILAYSSSRFGYISRKKKEHRKISSQWLVMKLKKCRIQYINERSFTLWSTDNARGSFPRHRTALESPQFATMIWEEQTMATTAVEPTVSGATLASLPISASTLRKVLVNAFLHCSWQSLVHPSFDLAITISNSSVKAWWNRSRQ